MGGKKIVWLSQHAPLSSQIDELLRCFGPTFELVEYKNSFDNADDIVKEFRRLEGDEMVAVVPLSVIEVLLKRGIKPLYAEMELCGKDEAEVTVRKRRYKFIKFTRITGIEIKKEEVEYDFKLT